MDKEDTLIVSGDYPALTSLVWNGDAARLITPGIRPAQKKFRDLQVRGTKRTGFGLDQQFAFIVDAIRHGPPADGWASRRSLRSFQVTEADAPL